MTYCLGQTPIASSTPPYTNQNDEPKNKDSLKISTNTIYVFIVQHWVYSMDDPSKLMNWFHIRCSPYRKKPLIESVHSNQRFRLHYPILTIQKNPSVHLIKTGDQTLDFLRLKNKSQPSSSHTKAKTIKQIYSMTFNVHWF